MQLLMNILMVSCKQAAFLGTKKSLNALSLKERLSLAMHQKICKACTSLSKDSALIDEAIEKIIAQKASQNLSLTSEQRERILAAIK